MRNPGRWRGVGLLFGVSGATGRRNRTVVFAMVAVFVLLLVVARWL